MVQGLQQVDPRLDGGTCGHYSSRVPSLLGMPQQLKRACARLLLLALSAAALHGVHTRVRQDLLVIHVEQAHHFDAAPAHESSRSRDLCLACHLARTPCGPATLESSPLAYFTTSSLLVHRERPLTASVSWMPTPARAPPIVA
jgi:hypothetical protein